MKNLLSTYLNSEEYRISILQNGIHIMNYQSVIDITENEAILRVGKKLIKIYGQNLRLTCLDKKELLLDGIIKKVLVNEH